MNSQPVLDLTNANAPILNSIVEVFRQLNTKGIESLGPVALYICGLLLIIELATDWALYEGNLRLSKIINDIIKGSFFFFIIYLWGFFVYAIEDFFVKIGLLGGGVKNGKISDPSSILDQGFTACKKLFAELPGVSVDSNNVVETAKEIDPHGGDVNTPSVKTNGGGFFGSLNPMRILTYLVAIAMIIFAHLWIALQVFICQIEYYIFTTLALVFVPFGVCKHTNFLFQKTVSGLVNFGVKLMGLFFLIAIANTSLNLMNKQLAIEAGQPFSAYLRIGLVYLCIAYLVWELPDKLGSLLSGNPSLSGGSAFRTAAAAATGAVAVAAGGIAASADAHETWKMSRAPGSVNGGSGGTFAGATSASATNNQSASGSGSHAAPAFASYGGSDGSAYSSSGGTINRQANNSGWHVNGSWADTDKFGDAAVGGSGGVSTGFWGGNKDTGYKPAETSMESIKEVGSWKESSRHDQPVRVAKKKDSVLAHTGRFLKFEAQQALAGSILAPWVRGANNAQLRQNKWRSFRDGIYGGPGAISNYEENDALIKQENSRAGKEWNDLE